MSMRTPVPGDGDRTEDEHIDYIAEGIVEVRDWRVRVIDFSFPLSLVISEAKGLS